MPNKVRTPLAVLCPMKEELEWVLGLFPEAERSSDGLYRIYTAGRLTLVLAKSGVGKVNTAYSATQLALQFQPSMLLMLGCAASLQTQVKLGSLVLASKTAYHDVHAEVFGYATGQLPGEKASFSCPQASHSLATEALNNAQLHFASGLLLSGDQFVEQGSRELELIQKNFPKAMALEMEGAALAHVAERLGLSWIVLRIISDSLSCSAQSNKEQFKRFFSSGSVEFAQKFLEQLLKLHEGIK